MPCLAKFSEKTGKKQTLLGHTIDCLKILKCYFERNEKVVEQFCKRWNTDKQIFMRNLFVAVYLHDIGKLTREFQKRISEGKHSQQYPHAFYGFPIVWEVFKTQFREFVYSDEPLIETLSILAHHTQLYDGIYRDTKIREVHLLEEEIFKFINKIDEVYKYLGFDRFFSLRWNKMESLRHSFNIISQKNPQEEIRKCIMRTQDKVENLKGEDLKEVCKLKSIYSYFLSILKLCDYYASVEFSEYVMKSASKEEIFSDILEKPEKYVLTLPEINETHILKRNKPHAFQEEIKERSPAFCLLFAPCGRGKTEAALLWAFEVCRKCNRNKIIFAMPTQTTSNAMRDRFIEWLNEAGFNEEEYVGLYHGKSFVKFKEERKTRDGEEDEDELSEEDVKEIKGENFKGNVFFKPITVTTIDHLILSFVHGFPQADFALGNLQNAVIVFDEVHYYEKQTLKHLVDMFKILRKMKIPHLLMSGTLPDFLIERANRNGKEEEISYELIEDGEGLNYTPFRVERYPELLVSKDELNEKVIDEIIKNFEKGLNQFIILNTVERSQKMYKELKERLDDNHRDKIFLLHSQFTYRDRNEKEEKIITAVKKEKKRPVILVATQVIEISLDISCDIMYTELAPADALGQRGGRINRGNKNWKENGKEYILKIFQPENELPYDRDILQNTDKSLEPGVYSYLKLKEICNSVYGRNYIEVFEEKGKFLGRYSLINWSGYDGCFEKTCLFGPHPKEIAPDEETQIGFIIRPEKQRKFEVIPWIYYQGDKKNLKVENKAKVPLWWVSQDEKEHGKGNLQWFEKIEKTIGRKKKTFWICKLPYDPEYGFDSSRIPEINFDDCMEGII